MRSKPGDILISNSNKSELKHFVLVLKWKLTSVVVIITVYQLNHNLHIFNHKSMFTILTTKFTFTIC